MIRTATIEDIDSILPMCVNFWEQTIYDEPLVPEDAILMLEAVIGIGLLAVAEVEDVLVGFVAGVKAPLIGNRSTLIGSEVAWWIEPEHRKGRLGIDLMHYIENLAKIQGIKYWNMVSMESSSPEVANKIYNRFGYHKTETSFTKVI